MSVLSNLTTITILLISPSERAATMAAVCKSLLESHKKPGVSNTSKPTPEIDCFKKTDIVTDYPPAFVFSDEFVILL
jgi:hypothetical protein